MIPIISVVGKTNSGKTTLVERIITNLKKCGYRVGVIKYDVHGFEIDGEGKDSFRMRQAGAETVVIASDKKIGLAKMVNTKYGIDELVNWLFIDVDIVITEGYMQEDKPKIEVTRTGELLYKKDDNLIAVIDNTDKNATIHLPDTLYGIPVFKLSEINKITEFIKNKFLYQNQVKYQNKKLSSREKEVLILLAKGFINKEIAKKLNISVKTVETYRARLMKKLNIYSRAELTQYAIKSESVLR